MLRNFLILFLFASLAACQTITPPPNTSTPTPPQPTDTTPAATATIPAESGIYGQVLLGPTCPGPERLGATECADQPLQASITVTDLNGKFVTRFESGVDGRFKIPLEPGVYILQPKPGNPLPHASELKVTVPPGQYVEVLIQYDSGIR